MLIRYYLVIIILYVCKFSFAQASSIVYHNKTFNTNIKSITIKNLVNNNLPVYFLGDNNKLEFSFDDLEANYKDLYYTIVHCEANWQESNVSPTQYLNNLNEDRITDIQSSINTVQKYTHYKFQFPTQNLSPKISGNYILKVFEDGDHEKLIFTRKIYVVNNASQIDAFINNSINVDQKSTNQRIQLKLNTTTNISNPQRDLKINILQNLREDKTQSSNTPSSIIGNTYIYNVRDLFDFKGDNEFRTIDLRSLRSNSISIDSIDNSKKTIYLHPDSFDSNNKYEYKEDNNGKFFVRNLDNSNPNLESDYIDVIFQLNYPNIENQKIFVGGYFNAYETNHSLNYNTENQKYDAKIKLKQGIYDYIYFTKKSDASILGSYFQTENDYQIFVYYRRPNTHIDELIGFKEINSLKHNINNQNRE